MDKRARTILIGAVLAIGAVLRLWEYWAFSYSNDELSALARLGYDSIRELVWGGVRPDGHPAAAQVLLWQVTRWFGDHEAVTRLPFVLASIGSILYSYRMGRAWGSVTTGLLTASAVATLEFTLLYGRIARPYALGLLFATMAGYHWVRVMRQTHTTLNLWMLALSLALCAYTHYFCGLTAALMALTGTLLLKGDALRHYLYALGGAIVLFLPHLSITLHQLSMGGVAWVGVPKGDWPLEHVQYVFNRSYMMMGVMAGTGALGWLVFRPHRRWTQWLLPLIFFVLPLGIGFFYSVHVSPVLQHSVLLFSFPFLLLFLFMGWEDRHTWLSAVAVVAVLAAGYASTVHQNGFYHTEHFGVFRQLAYKAVEWHRQHGSDVLLVADVNHPSYLDRYLQRSEVPDLRFAQYRVTDEGGLLRLKQLMAASAADHLAYAHSTINQTPEVERIIREKYPVRVDGETHFNSGIALFRKGEVDRRVITSFPFSDGLPWQCDTSHVHTDSLNGIWYALDRRSAYGPNAVLPVKGLEKGITAYIEATLPDTVAEVNLVFEQWSGDERYVWEARPLHAQIGQGENGWAIADFSIQTPKGDSDNVKLYCWTVNGAPVRIRHFELRRAETR